MRRRLAVAHETLGNALTDSADPREAEPSFLEAIALQSELAREFPALRYFADLAHMYGNYGPLLQKLGRAEDALSAYGKSEAIRESLVQAYPKNLTFLSGLATSLLNEGSLLNDLHRYMEARVKTERALEIQEQLAREHPSIIAFQDALASLRNNLGLIYRAQNDFTAALDSLTPAYSFANVS